MYSKPMKTKVLLLIIGFAVWSSCSKDDSEPSSVKSDYRDAYIGNFECKITHYLYMQGKPLQVRDTFATVEITKLEKPDSAIHLSYNIAVLIKANGTLYYYNAFDPNSDSLGYIDSDSIYLNYLVDASIGGRDWFEMKGKKL